MSVLRRIRGLFGLAVAGAISWVPLGLAAVAIEALLRGRAVPWHVFPRVAVMLSVIGAACGLFFGIILFAMDRRRGFSGLTLGRTAIWGALGGMVIPLVLIGTGVARTHMVQTIVNFAMYGGLGAIMSAGALAVARRAPALSSPSTAGELPEGE